MDEEIELSKDMLTDNIITQEFIKNQFDEKNQMNTTKIMINDGDCDETGNHEDAITVTKLKKNLLMKTRSMPSSPNSFRQIQSQKEDNEDDNNEYKTVRNKIIDRQCFNNDKQLYLTSNTKIRTPFIPNSIMKDSAVFTKLEKKCTSEPDIITKKQNIASRIKLSNSDSVGSNDESNGDAQVGEENSYTCNNKCNSVNMLSSYFMQEQSLQPSESKSEGQIANISKFMTVDSDGIYNKVSLSSSFLERSSNTAQSNSCGNKNINTCSFVDGNDLSQEDGYQCVIVSGTGTATASVVDSYTIDCHKRTPSADSNLIQDQEQGDSGSGENNSMIPDSRGGEGIPRLSSRNNSNNTTPQAAEDGLIVPKKIQNPCLDSIDRQNLHRELLFNQKIGKNVLNQKSELQKALEKHKDSQAKKELELQKLDDKTPLERVIEERARRLENLEKSSNGVDDSKIEKPEFLQVHARLRARMDSK